MTKKICEKVCNGTPVEMVMDSYSTEFLVTVRCKKMPGKPRDIDHDIENFKTVEFFLADEILQRDPANDPMSSFLQSFVGQAWEDAEDIDPWYMEEPLVED